MHDVVSLSLTLGAGGLFSRLFSGLWGSKEMRILILGLDGAGKTTILYRLQVGEVVTTIPSKRAEREIHCQYMEPQKCYDLWVHPPLVPCGFMKTDPSTNVLSVLTAIGFNVESVTYKNLKFQGKVISFQLCVL